MGTVVEVYGVEAVEVEFVRIDGNTHAVVTPPVTHLRPLSASDLPGSTHGRRGGLKRWDAHPGRWPPAVAHFAC
jgi:hypothetical protein